MLMVMALYEEEKRRIERNMLALSNLNLATSSFVGGEIQRMLSQALDRVLGVVRLPAGALFLHHGDPQGPTSVVAVGLSDEFCRAAQNESLDDYLVSLVARLGGLLGFRDLRDDSLSALEKEKSIRRFRELALAQGLRSVVAISLQAKEQAFGVLLLGTPDSRRFTPAELRLLLALGHQIGMAVENSYLIQQTSRRSEELHVLNEIGRVLSSTLNKEDLLGKIWEELRRLFDEGHLELLRVLASEASIAIENARLFYNERTKARHLALLNNISRNAIATLNPDEMLAKIAEQLEIGLTYDHRHRPARLFH